MPLLHRLPLLRLGGASMGSHAPSLAPPAGCNVLGRAQDDDLARGARLAEWRQLYGGHGAVHGERPPAVP
jgi:hypothetical protein